MNSNIGILNEIFFQNINNIINKKNGGKIIKEYVSLYKNNKDLLTGLMVFENLTSQNIGEDSKEFIEGNIKFIQENVNIKTLASKISLVENFLDKNKIVKISDVENGELFESIHKLIFLPKSITKINEKVNITNKLSKMLDDINDERGEDTSLMLESPENSNLFYKILVDKFNEKYESSLNEEEKKIFETITSSNSVDDKKSIFEEIKKECLTLTNELLKENIEVEVREKTLLVKEKLLDQTFSEGEYVRDIVSLNKLKKTLIN